jgi:hypothetical protein
MKKTLEQINQEIEALKQEAEALEMAKNRPNYALEDFADHLHYALCKDNHIDYCSYEYESWDNPGYSKDKYMKRAKMILEFMTKNEPIFRNVSFPSLIHIINVAANG